jgi:hypothetical protein
MTRECHVRFSEGVGVGFPRATRPSSRHLILAVATESSCLTPGDAPERRSAALHQWEFGIGRLPSCPDREIF